jgi:glycosyltransferase involved in cell wall biosynthesis
MRILQVAPYFHPYIGGQERYVRNLARALVKRGHKVEVFTSNFPKSKKHETIDGIEVTRFDYLCKPLNNPVSPMFLPNFLKRCKEFDVVHCHNEHAILSQYCRLVKPYSKVPLVITCHGQLKFDNPSKDFFETAYRWTLGSGLLNAADRVVTISDSDKEYVQSFDVPTERIRVIPNGVDLDRYSKQLIDLPKELQFGRKRIILFVGPVIKRKGPHVLVEAIPSIIKEHPDTIFVFAGKGDFKEETENLSHRLEVDEYTRFLGYVPENHLHGLYQRCEALVLPSFSEALAYTILDAFVFSKPVVSSLIPCITDYLHDHAILVPPGDSKALGNSLIQLLSDGKLAKDLGEKGRKIVENRFTWDSVVTQMEEIYREVSAKKNQS